MSKELNFVTESGVTIYAIIRRVTDNYVWQTTTSTFVAWVNGDIANYDVALTDRSGDYYEADFPSGITTAGSYIVTYYYTAGSPAITDDPLGSETIYWDGAGVGSPPAGSGPSAGTVTLTIARAYLRRQARIAGSTDDYSNSDLDDAISNALGEFLEDGSVLKFATTIALTTDNPVVDLSTLPSDWRPEFLREVNLVTDAGVPISDQPDPLEMIDWGTLRSRAASDTSSGNPNAIAFLAWDVCRVHPAPADDRSLVLAYRLPEISFTHGGSSVTLRTPADLLYPVLATLGIAYLQGMEKDHAPLAQAKRAEYEAWMSKRRGTAGSLAARSIQRMTLREANARGW